VKLTIKLLLLLLCVYQGLIGLEKVFDQPAAQQLPTAYQGRYRPLASTAEAWAAANGLPRAGSFVEMAWRSHFTPTLYNVPDPLIALPLKRPAGQWVSLKTLLNHADNFTPFSDSAFSHLKNTYIQLNQAVAQNQPERILLLTSELSQQLTKQYQALSGQVIEPTLTDPLFYPTSGQLYVEWIYVHYPWNALTLVLYAFALISFLFSFTLQSGFLTRSGIALALIAFLLHTALLSMRIYILERAPVSNMHETVIYVPWIAMLLGGSLALFSKQTFILFASSLIAFVLLLLLRLTQPAVHLENVQAVLNSQYWLVIHVLMIVASYGAFILAGILGHALILQTLWQAKHSPMLGNLMVQSIYIGTALIIPGTILGGVWAAESWGRFWDWDPKESWAFISSCVYLAFIHAYRFHKIDQYGLACGSIIGLLAISFTWYGVNFILGTGLHSYGFGSGGELFYYLFVTLELLFVGIALYCQKSRILT
jgi:ABC-type transport system involved in cytochrome c biogenesis permease subunit